MHAFHVELTYVTVAQRRGFSTANHIFDLPKNFNSPADPIHFTNFVQVGESPQLIIL